MGYRFKRTDESVADGARRIAIEQIDKAIAEIDDTALDRHVAVHQVRKRCKKLRGLVRLIRPSFPDYAKENAAFRDAARELSGLRDTEALLEAYDSLTGLHEDQIDRQAFGSIRRRLTLRQKQVKDDDIDRKLAGFREQMVLAKVRALRWQIEDDGAETFADGLAKTYARARKAMRTTRKDPTAETFHDWRKRVKYHGYHARLLAPVWPEPMTVHVDAAATLADLLGDHHDLDVFEATLREEPDAFGDPKDIEVFLALIGRRRTSLEHDAFALGDRLLAETDRALAERWTAYWHAWGREGAEATEKTSLAA
ncbi:CHAD domain-containing protein [Amorphus orientalis]|uniref:CHAD domain-containing protein n=1 Tax=Amorphus orientalis TaxID=649198 RepID=A0AAE3VKU5_9HYPH|nr:CHAD domain-containing protein [Amorphus orientalis]MDQ0313778.1 CHAD domain-containing protein [Amorphus orientalis]